MASQGGWYVNPLRGTSVNTTKEYLSLENKTFFVFFTAAILFLVQSWRPRGLVGGPRAYRNQFRGFKSHRVHALMGFFLHKQIHWRKARERELATFDEDRRAVGMLNPMGDKK